MRSNSATVALGQSGDRDLGEHRIGPRHRERILLAFDQLHAEGKALFADKGADEIEQILVIVIDDAGVQLGRQGVAAFGQAVGAGIDQAFEQLSAPRQCIGKRGRIAQYVGQQLQQCRAGIEQVEEIDRTRQRLDHIVETRERIGGIGRMCQRRHDLGQYRLERLARRA